MEDKSKEIDIRKMCLIEAIKVKSLMMPEGEEVYKDVNILEIAKSFETYILG